MLAAGDPSGADLLITQSDGGIAKAGMDLMLSLLDSGSNMELIAAPRIALS